MVAYLLLSYITNSKTIITAPLYYKLIIINQSYCSAYTKSEDHFLCLPTIKQDKNFFSIFVPAIVSEMLSGFNLAIF